MQALKLPQVACKKITSAHLMIWEHWRTIAARRRKMRTRGFRVVAMVPMAILSAIAAIARVRQQTNREQRKLSLSLSSLLNLSSIQRTFIIHEIIYVHPLKALYTSSKSPILGLSKRSLRNAGVIQLIFWIGQLYFNGVWLDVDLRTSTMRGNLM